MRILIVEDYPDTVIWLQHVLEEAFPGAIIDDVFSVEGAQAKVFENYNLCLIDLSLPDGSGIDVIREFCKSAPDTICVVSTIHADDSHIFPAMKAGASGYLLKDQSKQDFIQQLRGILNGTPPLSPSIARSLLNYFRISDQQSDVQLTPRETEVLQLIGKGMQRNEIAKLLNLSQHTIASYAKNIYKKLNINSCSEATIEAMRRGLL